MKYKSLEVVRDKHPPAMDGEYSKRFVIPVKTEIQISDNFLKKVYRLDPRFRGDDV